MIVDFGGKCVKYKGRESVVVVCDADMKDDVGRCSYPWPMSVYIGLYNMSPMGKHIKSTHGSVMGKHII